MLQKEHASKDFGVFFLLQFTRELIRHSLPKEVEINVTQLDKEEIKQKVKQTLKEESKLGKQELSPSILKRDLEPSPLIVKPRIKQQIRIPTGNPLPIRKPLLMRRPLVQKNLLSPQLKIPEPVFPKRLQYLKPIPTNREIDLGKLNRLIKDPLVNIIECNGQNQNIIVNGTMGRKKTDIILSKEEMDEVFDKFSEATKIPLQDGIFKVVVGRLILLAIISEVVSSVFIIKKMLYSPGYYPGFSR
jgi:hypothetical protein